MKAFIKNYPVSLIVIAIIFYLSFFTPPKTRVEEIPNIDKIVHFCMYGGLTFVIWTEYLWHHNAINWKRLIVGGILCPIIMSGLIEIGQGTLTVNRSGDWMDFVANSLGVLVVSYIGYHFLYPFIFRYKRNK